MRCTHYGAAQIEPSEKQGAAPLQNLTGMENLWGDMNLAGQNMGSLSEEERLARKKKLMAAGNASDFQSAMSVMFGNRLNSGGTPRA